MKITRMRIVAITLCWIILTVGAPDSFAASLIFEQYWEEATAMVKDSDPAHAKEKYVAALRELQIRPWSMGLNAFKKVDELAKFFIQSKDYAKAAESLKFAIELGGSYRYLEQLADLYRMQGKSELAAQTEQKAREYVKDSADSWGDGQALLFTKFCGYSHLQSARCLKSGQVFEITLKNGMIFQLSFINPNKGNGLQSDPTLPPDFVPPPPDDMVQLAQQNPLVILFKKPTVTRSFEYTLSIASRFYKATLTSDLTTQYLREGDTELSQDLRAYMPMAPATIIRKERDEIPGWWKITLNRRGYWALSREDSFKIADSEAALIKESDRLLLFARSAAGFLTFRFLSLKDGAVLHEIQAVEAPYRAPSVAEPRVVIAGQQRPMRKDYSMATALIEKSDVLCRSALIQPLDIGQAFASPSSPNRIDPRTPQVAVVPVVLQNGMSFDVVVESAQRWRSIAGSGEGGEQENRADSNSVSAAKGSVATVFFKYVGDQDVPSEREPVCSLFVAGNVYEAIPRKSFEPADFKSKVIGLEHCRGVCVTEVKDIQTGDSSHSDVTLDNNTSCEVSDTSPLDKGKTVILLWNPEPSGDEWKLLTDKGVCYARPPHMPPNAVSNQEKALVTQAVPVRGTETWASSGWHWNLPGPSENMMVSVAYPVEVTQAVVAIVGGLDPSFDFPKWTANFAWGLREIWWHLVTQAEPTPISLNEDLMKTEVPKMPILKGTAPPVLPPIVVKGEAQVLITINRNNNGRTVTASIFQSTLPAAVNHALVRTIEANASHSLFTLPDSRQLDKASFLVRFRS